MSLFVSPHVIGFRGNNRPSNLVILAFYEACSSQSFAKMQRHDGIQDGGTVEDEKATFWRFMAVFRSKHPEDDKLHCFESKLSSEDSTKGDKTEPAQTTIVYKTFHRSTLSNDVLLPFHASAKFCNVFFLNFRL